MPSVTSTTWTELKTQRLDAIKADERAEYDGAYAVAVRTAEAGDRVREAREADGQSGSAR